MNDNIHVYQNIISLATHVFLILVTVSESFLQLKSMYKQQDLLP